MPLPKPQSGESESEFISRCMANDTMQSEFPDDDQRLAVCERQYGKNESSMKKQFQTKDVGSQLAIKDIDTESGIVEGYFAAFGNIDSDGDMFQKGAFAKSIQENKERIMHLLQHDIDKPLARPELFEDEKGLGFKSKIAKTSYGNDTLELYKEGVYNEHSVGFITLNEEQRTSEIDGEEISYNLITEVKLMEGSTVTWGANEQTPTTGIKGLNFDQSKKLFSFVENIERLLKKGSQKITDDTFRQLEIQLAQIKALLPDYESSQEPQKSESEQFLKTFVELINE